MIGGQKFKGPETKQGDSSVENKLLGASFDFKSWNCREDIH